MSGRRKHLQEHVSPRKLHQPTTSSVLALLMMSLGRASRSIVNIAVQRDLKPEEHEYQVKRKVMADICFDEVLRKSCIPHTEMSTIAVQCLFYTA